MENIEVKIFKDSVHGYINIPSAYVKNLIDNTYFQRLRNIDQTGMRVLYPAAKHDRFSHSLGVFHLGQKAMDALLKDSNKSIFTQDISRRYRILFLSACLLHDIGHTPFSHSLEEQILENSILPQHQSDTTKKIAEYLIEKINEQEKSFCIAKKIQQCEITTIKAAPHEQLGALLIFDKLSGNIKSLEEQFNIFEDDIVWWDDLCFIVRMIMGIKYDEFAPERQARNCFIELLNGDNFDVDKLDYIVRDTQMSGISNVAVDVERLLGSLCVVTKTKHLNKFELTKENIQNLTISEISNKEQNTFEIDGRFNGIIKIDKGAEIEIRRESTVKIFKGVEQDSAQITYLSGDRAIFSSSTILKQNNEWVNAEKMEGFETTPVKLLPGTPKNTPFNVFFEKAELKKDFKIKAKSDIEIHIFGECSIKIKGKFEAIGSLKLFKLRKLQGAISEVEILGNTFIENFTSLKEPSEHGYNTYSIGFKKQAINVIANVLEARNYLYLWVYAHPKVIYYANFLIPVIAKEIAQYCCSEERAFPSWKFDYTNLDKLDDYYIWTAIKYIQYESKSIGLKMEYDELINQLFSRSYNRSLYKSLAEFELFFASFTVKQKLEALRELRTRTDSLKPFLVDKKNKKYLAGYLNNDSISEINKLIIEITEKRNLQSCDITLSQVTYVVTEFKQKKLDPNKVFLDMIDEILPISQISLLSANHIENKREKDKYFYIYYKSNDINMTAEKAKIIKEAIKKYLSKNS